MNDSYSPYTQSILLLLGLFLLLLWANDVFKNPDYNKLCLIYSIVILLWDATIAVRYLYLYQFNGKVIENPLIEIPCGVKCYFGEQGCEKGNFTFFTIIHLVMYIVIGFLVPGYYIEILLISIACELLEAGLGVQSKFLLDPVVNMIGYVIGTQFRYLYDKM